ncbi:MAG: helix-turn-helix domain-containing protein [Bacteroidetes bacterium]|jgi:transcriptional regulator with XRE-family HTH domain|nr:helix-turn-helix domain-containing protein [Bacteroidota bacterium]
MNSDLLLKVGVRIRELRIQNDLKLIEVASSSGISKGLLSKIENGRTIPSLPVLFSIIKALKTSMNDFFNGLSSTNNSFFIHRTTDDYEAIIKENAIGFHYKNILQQGVGDIGLEIATLDLEPDARRKMVVTDGMEYLYILKGELDYILAEQKVFLKEGDSLFFDGRIPHVPRNPYGKHAKLLVIYLISQSNHGKNL